MVRGQYIGRGGREGRGCSKVNRIGSAPLPPPSQSQLVGVRLSGSTSNSRAHDQDLPSSSSKGHQLPPPTPRDSSKGCQSLARGLEPLGPSSSKGRAITFARKRGKWNQ